MTMGKILNLACLAAYEEYEKWKERNRKWKANCGKDNSAMIQLMDKALKDAQEIARINMSFKESGLFIRDDH